MYSMAAIFYINCNIREAISVGNLQGLWNLLINIFGKAAFSFHYVPSCVSSLERYLSVCKPLSANQFKTHLGKVSILLAIANLLILGVISLFQEMCINPIFGPIQVGPLIDVVISLLIMLFVVIFTTTLNILVLLEIGRMKKNAPETQGLAELRQSSRYIMIVNIAFNILMAPYAVIAPVINHLFAGKNPIFISIFIWVGTYSHSIYGIFNTVLFVVMFESYRKQLLKMLHLDG